MICESGPRVVPGIQVSQEGRARHLLDWEAEEIVPLRGARLTDPPAVEEAGRQDMEAGSSPGLLIELVQDIRTVPEIRRVIARVRVLRYQTHQIGRCEDGAWLRHGQEGVVDHIL